MNMEHSICYQTISSAIKAWWSSKPKSHRDKLACYLAILAPPLGSAIGTLIAFLLV